MEANSEENVTDPNDVAENFVSMFYRDGDEDDINTDEEEEGNLFDLYKNSRPLTPLSVEGQNPMESEEDPPDGSQASSEIELAASGAVRKQHQQKRTSTINVSKENEPKKRDLESPFSGQMSQSLKAAEDPQDVDESN